MFVIVYDMAARGERSRALAIWDELIAPDAAEADAGRRAAIRELLRDPANSDARFAINVDDPTNVIEVFIALKRFELLLDLAEQVQKQDRDDRRRQWWLRSAWLPSTLALREDPRFFAIAEDLGMVRLWEKRGYPNGCQRVSSPNGERLECADTSP